MDRARHMSRADALASATTSTSVSLKTRRSGTQKASAPFPFKGQIATFTTPFTSTGAIDYPSVEKETIAAIKAGVSGFIVPAHASEVEVLSNEEQDKLVAVVVNAVNSSGARGTFGVFRGLYQTNLTDRVRAARKAVALGAQGIDIDVPYVTGPGRPSGNGPDRPSGNGPDWPSANGIDVVYANADDSGSVLASGNSTKIHPVATS